MLIHNFETINAYYDHYIESDLYVENKIILIYSYN
jgi:hypothetical protein